MTQAMWSRFANSAGSDVSMFRLESALVRPAAKALNHDFCNAGADKSAF
jgi:hypothetical protein